MVTPTSYGQNDPALRIKLQEEVQDVVYNMMGRPLSSGELQKLVLDSDGFIAGLDTIDCSVIQKANRLKVIARYGVGVDNIDLVAAKSKEIIVTNTPGANSASVAELTVGLILSLARSIPDVVAKTKTGEWPRISGWSLVGKVVGLLGFGSIGKQVARRLRGFDCSTLAYDPVPDMAFAREYGVQIRTRDDVIRNSDFLSLHVPLLEETTRMVNAPFLNQMKIGAFLINTARGELVDEECLYEALKGNKLQGAALDVFTKQPPGRDNPLLKLPQVIATPHIGSHTDGSMNAMGWTALNDCLAVLRGEQPINRVI